MGSDELGNRALRVANWYYVRERGSEERHIFRNIEHPECVDVGLFRRVSDRATGKIECVVYLQWSKSSVRADRVLNQSSTEPVPPVFKQHTVCLLLCLLTLVG